MLCRKLLTFLYLGLKFMPLVCRGAACCALCMGASPHIRVCCTARLWLLPRIFSGSLLFQRQKFRCHLARQ